MTAKQIRSIQHQLGKRTIRTARQQFAAELALLNEVFVLSEMLAAWDEAIEANALYDAHQNALDILDEIAQQDAPTPVSEPWWAKYIPLAALVGAVATFAPLFVL